MNIYGGGKKDRRDTVAVAAAIAVAVTSFAVAWSPVDFVVIAAAVAAFALILRAEDRTNLFILGLVFPFQGLRIYIPALQDELLLRFFPDGIDLPVGYAFAGLVVAALLTRWTFSLAARRVPKPRLPLVGAAALFWASAALSSIGAVDDRLLVLKYAAYPIAFSFIAYVLLPAQLVKGKEESLALVRGMVASGAFVAAMGAASLFAPGIEGLWRAAPLPIFGVWPVGQNHNLLAEALVATAPLALLLAELSRGRKKFLLRALSAAMALVALLTFARTAWIAFACMASVAIAFEYKEEIRRHIRLVVLVALLAFPLVAVFVMTSATREVGGSTASRLAMTGYSLYLFSSSPIVGVGAGTFISRLGQSQDFLQDFGDPLDAHGFGQKILAEQGIVGMVFFLFLLGRIAQVMFQAVRREEPGSETRRTLVFLSVAALGMIVYEIFNTTYYSPKMWLPIGAALAALPAWTGRKAPSI